MNDAEGAQETEQERTYQIGTVSSLTGIDAHTIRAWERRYRAIEPMRSESGRRQYSDGNVERLQLLKGLVDCREAISSIAHLPDEELRLRIAKLAELEGKFSHLDTESDKPGARPRIAILAPALSRQIEVNAVSVSDFDVCLSETESDRFMEALRQEQCDVIALELENASGNAVGMVQACKTMPGNPQVIVLYQFASRRELAQISRAGAAIVRTPIRLEALRRVVLDQVMIGRARRRSMPRSPYAPADAIVPASHGPAPRRFDDEQLARLLELTSALDCECPNHLSSLITELVAFESYSRDCESRDEVDAAQHRRLAEGTGEARVRMEELLVELCKHEEIFV